MIIFIIIIFILILIIIKIGGDDISYQFLSNEEIQNIDEKYIKTLEKMMLDLNRETFDISRFLVEGNQTHLIAIKDDELVGHLRYNEDNYLSAVVVNPNFRGMGICNHLLSQLDGSFQLHVLSSNIPAIKCYERAEFKTIKKEIMDGEEVLLMKN
jgi:ribosomal protein S18 acetylase RimI-like enzyme